MVRPLLRHSGIHPFSGWDIPRLIDTQAQSRKDHPFLIWEPFEGASRTWTYGQFATDTARIAAGLQKRGVRQGDHVMIHMDNCPEFLLVWGACARLGAISVTTNTRSVGDEIRYFAQNAQAVVAITQPKYANLISENCPELSWIAVTKTDGGAEPHFAGAASFESFDQLYGDPADLQGRRIDPFCPLSVMYTSGTTSRPKGVVWTHANGLWAARGSAFHEALTPHDTHLLFLPLFHMNAMSCSFLSTIWVGGTVVLQPRFSATCFWDVALKHQCSWSSLVPFCVNAIKAQDVPPHNFRAWGFGVSAPLIDRHFHVKTMGWWGMTETITVGIVTSTYHDDTPMSLGRPSPLYDIAIVSEDGDPVDVGDTGELRIRGIPGLSLFAEYHGNPEATEASFDDQGFFITGDRCTLLEDGSIAFSDRSKDMLKVGGENVAASEIERVIATVPGVREVAVVSKKDRMLDEVPVAFVLASDDAIEDELISRTLSKCAAELSDFKRPREVRIVAELPRATLEKVAKVELRALLRREAEDVDRAG